jgi:WD40 repeat protein
MRARKPPSILKSYAVAYAPDGGSLFTVGRDVVAWDPTTVKKRWRAHPLSNPSHLVVSPDSQLLAVKSTSGRIIVLEAATGSVSAEFENESDGEGGPPLFSTDGQYLIDCTWKGVHVVRTLDGRVVERTDFAPDMATKIHKGLGTTYWFQHVRPIPARVDNAPAERLLCREWPFDGTVVGEVVLPVESRNLVQLALSPDGKRVAAVLMWPKPQIALFAFPSMKQLVMFECQRVSYPMLKFSPEGAVIVSCVDGGVTLFDSETLSPIRSFDLKYACDAAFSPDGSHLVIGSWSAGTIINLRTMESTGSQ